jgi:predicted ATPase/DNA-binding SARP family transcriptional activator
MAPSLEQQVSVPGVVSVPLPGLSSGLPVQLTRFVGRTAELRQVRELLASARLLTLTGPGGSGKTRLALETVHAVEKKGEATVWWVELAALADAALVPPEVAATLRLIEEPGRSPTRALIEAIGSQHALLVLDNCEHLVNACALLSDQLLRACPHLRILATSREALGIAGETAWLVPPLSLPAPVATVTAASLEGSEAVALFVERARAVSPAFGITNTNALSVARICWRLDGIPLAIELAAARARVLTPAKILERLDDCFSLLVQRGRTTLPRHQTIRATIDWSYELLSPSERLLLQRLAVFAGGFTLEAAEQICAGGAIGPRDVLDLVAALVERSLVVMREREDSARYHLLEVVRHYAAERLAEQGAEAVEALVRRHAEFFGSVAEVAGPSLDVFQAPEVMGWVAAEHDNLRAALEWSLHAGDPLLALRISGALWPYWLQGTHWSDGLEWMARAIDAADPSQTTVALGRALLGAGSLAYALQDLQRARAWWEAAERIWQERASPRYLALLQANFGQLQIHLGNLDAALLHAEQGVRCARESADPHILAYTLATGLGFVHAFRGEAALADRFCAEAQQIALREEYQWGILVTSFSRAMTAWMHDDVEAAAYHAGVCVGATRQIDSPWFVPRVLLVPAGVAARRGEPVRAARLLGACDALRSSRGGRLLPVEQPYFGRIVEAVRAALDEDTFSRARSEGGTLGLQWALEAAEAAVGGAAASPAPETHCQPAQPPTGAAQPATEPVPPPAGSARVAAAPSVAASGAELRVRALGPLEIFRGEELLGTERWSYAKPRELLLYLLCNPRGATKEQIGLAIWPEATPSQVRNNLHVTLHYVRKALGSNEWIVYSEERYRLARERSVEFDLDTFEREATRALAAPEAAGDARLREVLSLYRGDFLTSEVFGNWHLEWRDCALQKYVELLTLLAERSFAREEYTEAKQLYQQIVRREELREDMHRRLMQCLARTGERARALRHFERLIILLREELDAEPEPETTELGERIRRAESV